MLTMEKTFDQAVYENTATEIIENLAESLMESKPLDNTYSSMVGIDKSVAEVEFSESIRDLYKKYHSARSPERINVQTTMKKYMDIMKVGEFNMSVNECIDLIIKVASNDDSKLYGVLLSTTADKSQDSRRITFNPLHPVISMELMADNSPIDRDNKIWTMNIFAWKDNFDNKDLLKKAYSDYNYIDEIANTIAAVKTKSIFTVKNSNIKAHVQDNKFILKYEEKKYHISNGKEAKDNDDGKRNWIVPLQLLNRGGIAYPYYGSVYTKNGMAWNLSPMMSANINRPAEGSSRYENGSRICTKSGDSKTIKGVSALNHSNLTSPLNYDCFREGSLSFAYQSMLSGLEIISGKNLTNVSEKKKPLTFKEFIKQNPKENTKSYLVYMRDFVTSAELMDNTDIDEKKLAKKDLIDKQIYPNHNPLEDYVDGDIVIDQYLINNNFGGLRQMAGGVWIDYIKPFDLDKLEPTAQQIIPILPWRQEREYRDGSSVSRRGWIYEVVQGTVGVVYEEPMATSLLWTRVRQIEEQTAIEIDEFRREQQEAIQETQLETLTA